MKDFIDRCSPWMATVNLPSIYGTCVGFMEQIWTHADTISNPASPIICLFIIRLQYVSGQVISFPVYQSMSCLIFRTRRGPRGGLAWSQINGIEEHWIPLKASFPKHFSFVSYILMQLGSLRIDASLVVKYSFPPKKQGVRREMTGEALQVLLKKWKQCPLMNMHGCIL